MAISPIRLVATAMAASTVIGSSQVRARLGDILAERQLVGEEDRIEQRRLCPLGQILVIADVGQRQRRGRRMPPGRLVMAAAVDEQVQVQLPLHRAYPWLVLAGRSALAGADMGDGFDFDLERRVGQGGHLHQVEAGKLPVKNSRRACHTFSR